MLHAFLVVLVPMTAWFWAHYRQETFAADDSLQSALHVVFLVGVGLFVLTILIKALVAVPRCPKCNQVMREIETVDITEKSVFNLKTSSRWRIVECPGCNCRFRVPGLSFG